MPCNNLVLVLLWINYCALYQYSASLIFNIVNTVTIFSKNSDSENKNNYNIKVSMPQISLKGKLLC